VTQARPHTHTTKIHKQVLCRILLLYRYTPEKPPPLRCCRTVFNRRFTPRQWSSAQHRFFYRVCNVPSHGVGQLDRPGISPGSPREDYDKQQQHQQQ